MQLETKVERDKEKAKMSLMFYLLRDVDEEFLWKPRSACIIILYWYSSLNILEIKMNSPFLQE